MSSVPGTVINYTPAATGAYNGCPSLAILPDGGYLASHSHFGPGTTNSETFVYRSRDRGTSWRRIAHLYGQIWSKLFVHDGAVYLLGTDHCDRSGGRLNGKIAIRRSRDGVEWTEPRDHASGLLADEDGYHTAPVSVVVHGGRIWKAMEFAPEPERKTWKTFVMSAPADADLLDRSQWTFSEMYQHLWSDSQWIEGNVVVTPRRDLVNVLRLNRDKSFILNDGPHYGGDEQAAVVHVSADGTRLSHDRDEDSVPFTGGGTKFTIGLDPVSSTYLAIVNPQRHPDQWRNRLALSASSDLRRWRVVKELLFHPDASAHGFQYVDWAIDGDDIVYVSRTAHDDNAGGAHNAHDANYITFHRIERFRDSLVE